MIKLPEIPEGFLPLVVSVTREVTESPFATDLDDLFQHARATLAEDDVLEDLQDNAILLLVRPDSFDVAKCQPMVPASPAAWLPGVIADLAEEQPVMMFLLVWADGPGHWLAVGAAANGATVAAGSSADREDSVSEVVVTAFLSGRHLWGKAWEPAPFHPAP